MARAKKPAKLLANGPAMSCHGEPWLATAGHGLPWLAMEATAGQGDWGAWVGISTGGGAAIASPVMRLRIDAAGSQLKLTAMALVTDYGGVCDLYQPYSGTLYADGGLAWDLAWPWGPAREGPGARALGPRARLAGAGRARQGWAGSGRAGPP